ncbi:carbohydrate porin [Flavobacterium columnare]|uniref:Carbohydrate porin n=1 Tax=Flavobacterium columnare TaxID=996 RepID=A0A437UCX5_9FLAO|nr:carbohydrate porin [Flavobacterium columnare]RVU91470.1 carbohydrate porin [Flavobacterium columnare]
MKKIIYITVFLSALKSLSQVNDTINHRKGFTIHAQTTVINQTKAGFNAPYSGDNSLTLTNESKTSMTGTLYLGAKLWKGASIYLNPEIAGGSGLSEALGLGGATNGETFRIGNPEPKIYVARMFFKQIFDLNRGEHKKDIQNYFHNHSDFNQLDEYIPNNYLAFTIGKVSLADFFDDNRYSHDARTQFMNWGLMANGAWDYAANTRGYTPAIVLEYVTPKHELRYGTALLPLAANGNDMNWNYPKSSSHNLEYTYKFKLNKRPGAIRALTFFNATYMGDYQKSIALNPFSPDTKNVRTYGGTKFGFGLNAEQELADDFGVFARLSWNDGKYETWAFTEIDKSFSLGGVLNGNRWNRKNDVFGLAYLINGLSKPHQNYLKAGGKGFMLGDGYLNYTPEHIVETYYAAELVKNQMYLTGTYQFILNPGYNADRQGPINVFSIRVHCRI